MQPILDLFLHLDEFLSKAVDNYGTWIYALFFVIVFAETGLVILPFLPGDSLLFAAGALSASKPDHLNVWLVSGGLLVAASLGDAVNYAVGAYFGDDFLQGKRIKFVKQAHLDRTKIFFERYGGKAIVIARFVPIVRTIAPFFAGLGAMSYRRFVIYNIVGALLWVGVCVGAGYAFGNLPFVKKNFSVVIMGIVFISVLPLAIEWIMHRRAKAKSSSLRQIGTKPPS